MIENLTKAWQFIFNNHPRGDEIVHAIIETPEVVTTGQFQKWFHEAQQN